ncbi:HAMP domain-containing histidine kinase [Campylobacter sp. faydin G-24]|uniref:histidine kinase n=1 Tax=Campylobacter anatolicus TaxID=2829105 RepID=A0ABS5HFU5_9BACT|nr:HAMP domain-containing sensor histidine kinase [Campylobacter anatolicus]MBR8462594.1 HAMP domain-containing histidine kinase [Campylobacter anatolicus]MBR8462973.1 HAMP domain-containing histidine kinase [Campylobacter anatolicus]MBR8465706.1 HAMP domain-containing histidine kinase [Campylobacter anatolicus]
MQKSFKIPIISTIVIMALFVFQSLTIINLSKKDESYKNLFALIKFESQIKQLFLNNATLPNSMIYRYAIIDTNLMPIVSNLEKVPESLKFVMLEEDGYLYYKSFFFKDKHPYYIIVAQEQGHKKMIFIAALMLTLVLLAVFFILYVSYLGSVKPYKDIQKYMNNFFNDAMHELKTPLGVAGINLEMLGVDNKYTSRIKNALKQMQITYEDVEYFIKRGYIKFPKEWLDLGSYLSERVGFLQSVAGAKHTQLMLYVTNHDTVFISKLAAQRIIDNTITNAIKYSPADSKILINLYRDGDFVVFSVQDFGNGIKDIKRIWKRYEREDEVQGGFGLGLNIVSEICHKYDIIYDVKSEVNVGSIFSYKFKTQNNPSSG